MDAGSSYFVFPLPRGRIQQPWIVSAACGFCGQADLPRIYAIALRSLVYSLFLWAALFL